MDFVRWFQERHQGPLPNDRPSLEALKASLAEFKDLPTLPNAAVRALGVARDPNCSLPALAKVIETDVALAAGVLKLANSPLYRIGRSVNNLGHAVVRLGLRECQNLILTVGMRSIFRSVSQEQRFCGEQLWGHSFLTGCLCRELNRALRLRFDGEEFIGGITHDIGRVLILLGAPQYFATADPMDFIENGGCLDREREVLGLDHCLFGSLFADLNNLPSSLVSTILHHHTPKAATEHQRLVSLVATADHLANHLQRKLKIEDYDPATNLGWETLAQDWEEEQRAEYRKQLSYCMIEAALKAAEGVQVIAA